MRYGVIARIFTPPLSFRFLLPVGSIPLFKISSKLLNRFALKK